MRVKKIDAFGDTVSVREYVAGAAQRQITYPGLAQCISITGYHVGRLLGTHISPGSTADELDEHFRLLNDELGDHYSTWYLAGQLQEHFATSSAIMNSVDKLRKTVRSRLGKDATYYLLDTTSVTNALHSNYGIDIQATLVGGEPKFGFAKALGRKDKQFTPITAWYFNRL